MLFKNLIQSFKHIGEAIQNTSSTTKSVKIEDKIEVAESIRLTTKDFYRTYWHCRDFELTHLWQRSVFLTAFLVICFSAYGFLAQDMLGSLKSSNSCGTATPAPGDNYWITIHCAAIFTASIGLILSALWIMMAKGSKAWYEIYEAAIAAYEKDESYVDSTDPTAKDIGGFQYHQLKNYSNELNDVDNCWLNGTGGCYSPSRINWAIGVLMLGIWIFIILFHFVLLANTSFDFFFYGLLFEIAIGLALSSLCRKITSDTIKDIYTKVEKIKKNEK